MFNGQASQIKPFHPGEGRRSRTILDELDLLGNLPFENIKNPRLSWAFNFANSSISTKWPKKILLNTLTFLQETLKDRKFLEKAKPNVLLILNNYL